MAGQVNAGTPFVIQLGDFTEGLCGSRELQDRMFRGAIEQVKAKIKVPFLVTKGNHDITGPGAKESYRETLLPFLLGCTFIWCVYGSFDLSAPFYALTLGILALQRFR